jgi:hypothetical protein
MKNFLLGMAVGTTVGYWFHRDIEKAVREGLAKANEAVGEGPSATPPPATP